MATKKIRPRDLKPGMKVARVTKAMETEFVEVALVRYSRNSKAYYVRLARPATNYERNFFWLTPTTTVEVEDGRETPGVVAAREHYGHPEIECAECGHTSYGEVPGCPCGVGTASACDPPD